MIQYNKNLLGSSTASIISKKTQASGPTAVAAKNIFELINFRRNYIREQRRILLTRNLQEKLPLNYLLVHCAALGISGMAVIVLQIVSICVQAPWWWLLTGFWAGPYLFLLVYSIVKLEYYRTRHWMIIAMLLHSLGIFLSAIGLITLQILAMAEYNVSYICVDCVRFNGFQSVNMAILPFGFMCVGFCFAFLMVIEFCVLREPRKLYVDSL